MEVPPPMAEPLRQLDLPSGAAVQNTNKCEEENTLDRMLEDSTLRLIIAKLCFDYYADSKSEDRGAYLESLKSKLKDVESKLQNFVKAISAGVFNETVQQAMTELESQKHLLKEQIEAEELREKYDIKLDDIVKFFESFVGNLDDKKLREYVLDIFVDKIYVYKERMVITFHFTDDKQELSYEDTLAVQFAEARDLINCQVPVIVLLDVDDGLIDIKIPLRLFSDIPLVR